MELGHVEKAARLHEPRRHFGPAPHVRQPGDCAVGGEYDVEQTFEVRGQVVEVGDHEAGLDAHLRGEAAGGFDGRLGEVDARHGRAPAGPGERIETEVALEVQQRLATHVANLLELDAVEAGAAGAQLGKVRGIEVGGGVDRRDLVPVAAVGFDEVLVIGHGRMIAPRWPLRGRRRRIAAAEGEEGPQVLFVSILTSERSRDAELWALIWQGKAPATLKLHGAYNLAGNKRLYLWEGESAADLQFMDRFNYVGVIETFPAFDRTTGWQQAFAGDLEGFRANMVARGAQPARIEAAMDLRGRGHHAPTFEAAMREGRDWSARQANNPLAEA